MTQGQPEDHLRFEDAALCLAELGHPHRLRIFNQLARVGHGGAAVGELQAALAIPKSTLSHHLAQLVAIGLITQTREGRVLRCRIQAARALQLQRFLDRCCENLPTS